MTIKTRWVAGSSGTEGYGTGDATLTIEAYDTAAANYETAFEALYANLYSAVVAASPASWNGLARSKINWREDDNRTRRFLFDVQYSYSAPEATRRWSFDTTGGTVKLTTSKATTSYAITGRTAPDYQNAIGVQDGKPEGVDIVVPALKLTCTYRHAYDSTIVNASTIDAYIKSLASISGRTNDDAWLTYSQGELLFLGASGEYVPNKPTEIQYHFACSVNATGLSIGSIASIAKKGHEYIWVSFESSEDATAVFRVQRPLAAYVERVYEEIDFDTLGIH